MMTPLYSASAIAERVQDMAKAMNKDFATAKNVHVVVTLNGSFMFAADLVRQLNFPIEMHFAGVSSYHGMERGSLNVTGDALPPSFGGNPVLVIEDIMNLGNTVTSLRDLIAARNSGAIKVAALVKRQGAEGKADYYGFTVPQGLFVVGYGMDLNGRFRQMEDIQTLEMHKESGGIC